VTINELRANVALLQKSAGYAPSKYEKNTTGHVLKDGSDFGDRESDVEWTSESANVHIHIEERTPSKMITVTRIQKLTIDIIGTKSVRLLLQILPHCLLERTFSITSRVVQRCLLTLKMYLVFFSIQNCHYEIHHTKFYRLTIFSFFPQIVSLT